MAVVINTNISALKAQNSLRANNEKMATAMERLSTGNRINGAKDDAAGMAIADRMLGKLNGFTVAIRNSNDAISMMQTAEGDMTQISVNLQRIRELAIQSNNTTNSDTDRVSMQVETDQLVNEIQRIANASSFNGISLLNGDLKDASFQVGASNTTNDRISVTIKDVRTTTLGQTWREAHWSTGQKLTGTGATASVSKQALIDGQLKISVGAGEIYDIGTSRDDVNSATNFKTADSAAAKADSIRATISENDDLYDLTVVATTTVQGPQKTGTLSKNQAVELNLNDIYHYESGVKTAYNGVASNITFSNGVDADVVVGSTSPSNFDINSAAALAEEINAQKVAGASSTPAALGITATAETTLVSTVDSVAYLQDTEAETFVLTFSRRDNHAGAIDSTPANTTPVVTTYYPADITFNATFSFQNGGSEATFNTQMTAFAADIGSRADAAIEDNGRITASWDATAGKLTIKDLDGEDIQIDSFVAKDSASSTVLFDASNALKRFTGLEVGSTKGVVRITSAPGESFSVASNAVSQGMNATSNSNHTVTINGKDFQVDASSEYYQRTLVQEINDAKMGLKAEIDKVTKGINVVAEDGRNINISYKSTGFTSSQIGIAEGTYRGEIELISGNGAVHISGTTAGENAVGLSNKTITDTATVWTEGAYKGGATLDKISISTLNGANLSIAVIDNALDMVNQARATSGAYQNRFLAAVTNLSTAYTNLSAARSQIMDTDYATESTTLAKAQIVAQAATAMLAQANQSQQSVLALLK